MSAAASRDISQNSFAAYLAEHRIQETCHRVLNQVAAKKPEQPFKFLAAALPADGTALPLGQEPATWPSAPPEADAASLQRSWGYEAVRFAASGIEKSSGSAPSEATQPVDEAACAAVASALEDVRRRIGAAGGPVTSPTLVAVSKTKPVELLAAAYDAGQRHFGENYVHEVVSKAPSLPADVRWHFIGHLQSNKCKELLAVPGLACVHTVDSQKLAQELQKRASQARATGG